MASGYWEARKQNIKDNVSMRALVDMHGVSCQNPGPETQIRCPFHGNDEHASARIYSNNTMYCWKCTKSWDVISFVEQIRNVSFGDSCAWLEETFHLKKIDRIESQTRKENFTEYVRDSLKPREKDFDLEFTKVSDLLIRNRSSFTLEEYLMLFHRVDLAYTDYMANENLKDEEIQASIDVIRADLSKKAI